MMKRILCLLLALCLVPLVGCAQESAAAAELDVTAQDGRTGMPQDALRDGRDDTGYAFGRAREITFTATIPEDTPCAALYLRLDQLAQSASLLRKNDKHRWEEVASLASPGAECVLVPDEGLTGEIEVKLTFSSQTAVNVTELRFFSAGELPQTLHRWEAAGAADILLITDSLSQVDTSALQSWTEQGRTVAVASLTAPEENAAGALDALWDAGVRTQPMFGDFKPSEGADADTLRSAWHDKALTQSIVHWIRQVQPMLLLTGGSQAGSAVLALLVPDAVTSASDTAYETEDAADTGLWVVPHTCAVADEAALSQALTGFEERTDSYLRDFCAAEFADAVFSDPALIPYPADRQADGYLDGEFVYQDAEKGLWAYLSQTLQVQIVRYEQPDIPRVWFVTDVVFKPESESFGQVLYQNASFKDQQTYPETLAQNANLVLGVNGDYYPYRVSRGKGIGNILRNYKALYDYAPGSGSAYPNLDTLALYDDGSLTVCAGAETSATELAAQGNVHDALSFGPYLARDGALRVYDGASWDATEPRNAIGMVSPGHYRLVTVEGRFAKGVGPAGVDLNTLARLMYAQGVTDAFNLDGGSTAVLVFMGVKLNRTASKSGKSETSPRNMHELMGIGHSTQTATDMLNPAE